MATNVYVDGPNLYFAALKDTLHRWLDVARWVGELLPTLDIQRVRYYTAWANPASSSPTPAYRQRVYLRALATTPVSIHLGRCLTDAARLPLARDRRLQETVIKVREKGVDVLLATHLVTDAARGECDTAVVVSSDSDLRPAIESARQFGVRVGVVNPRKGRPGLGLRESADFHLRPVPASYVAAQFPPQMTDRHGPFHVPPEWVTT